MISMTIVDLVSEDTVATLCSEHIPRVGETIQVVRMLYPTEDRHAWRVDQVIHETSGRGSANYRELDRLLLLRDDNVVARIALFCVPASGPYRAEGDIDGS